MDADLKGDLIHIVLEAPGVVVRRPRKMPIFTLAVTVSTFVMMPIISTVTWSFSCSVWWRFAASSLLRKCAS